MPTLSSCLRLPVKTYRSVFRISAQRKLLVTARPGRASRWLTANSLQPTQVKRWHSAGWGLGYVSRSLRDGKFPSFPSLTVSGCGVLSKQSTGWKCLRVVINLPLAGVRRREGQMVYVISSWAVWETGAAWCGKKTLPSSLHMVPLRLFFSPLIR